MIVIPQFIRAQPRPVTEKTTIVISTPPPIVMSLNDAITTSTVTTKTTQTSVATNRSVHVYSPTMAHVLGTIGALRFAIAATQGPSAMDVKQTKRVVWIFATPRTFMGVMRSPQPSAAVGAERRARKILSAAAKVARRRVLATRQTFVLTFVPQMSAVTTQRFAASLEQLPLSIHQGIWMDVVGFHQPQVRVR